MFECIRARPESLLASIHVEGDTLVLQGAVDARASGGRLPGDFGVAVVKPNDGNQQVHEVAVATCIELSAEFVAPWLVADGDHDGWTGFQAEFKLTDDALASAKGEMFVVIRRRLTNIASPLTRRYRFGSAGHTQAAFVGKNRFMPEWDDNRGIVLKPTVPKAFATGEATVHDGVISLVIDVTPDFCPETADWSSRTRYPRSGLRLRRDAGKLWLDVDIAKIPGSANGHAVRLFEADGRDKFLHWSNSDWSSISAGRSGWAFVKKPGGLVRIVSTELERTADWVDLADGHIAIGSSVGGLDNGARISMVGARKTHTSGTITEHRTTLPVESESWGRTVAAPPSGGYRLWHIGDDGRQVPVMPSLGLSARLPIAIPGANANVRFEEAPDGQMYVNVSAPRRYGEGAAVRDWKAVFRRSGKQKSSGSGAGLTGVFVESWYGKSVSDNPWHLVSGLKAAGVPGPYSVVVADRSVEVPNGVSPVVGGTAEYWRRIHSARLVVFNTWLPSDYVKQPGQYVVQTWHGTPLKLLGADVPERQDAQSSAKRLAKGANKWDLLVSQNAYSSEIFRHAYLYEGEIAEVGYPRVDPLCINDSSLRVGVRARLGIEPGEQLILYAPTWRENNKGDIGPVNGGEMIAAMPAGSRLALRGHSVSLRRGQDVESTRMVDVTSYPDMTELMIASDCLVTDYSSAMFDYLVSGKPIVFFVPDYDDYLGTGRGGYFDLKSGAPGPVCYTVPKLRRTLAKVLSGSYGVSPLYGQWQEKFVPHDDGHAAERIAAIIRARLSEGSLSTDV